MKPFATAMIDPPWRERGGGRIKRGADRHYPLLATRDIPRVIMQSPEWRIADDAHLYLWATSNFIPDGLHVMNALGFRYVSNIVWVKSRGVEGNLKLQTGIGQYFRGQHELCIFGVRGDGYAVRRESRSVGSVVVAERRKHSEKPARFYELVERRSRGPYLELFGRKLREGWTVAGNEVAIAEAAE